MDLRGGVDWPQCDRERRAVVKMLFAVAMGGALGAVGRYWVTIQVGHLLGAHFFYGTLVVNMVGSFLLGALIETVAVAWSVSQETQAFLVIGFLGAFTTFSAFSMDTFFLFQRGEVTSAAVYVGASVVLSLFGFLAGLLILRQVLA
jgi:CrcB protein